MTRLLAYLTDDVARISPRWVVWLEMAMVSVMLVDFALKALRRIG